MCETKRKDHAYYVTLWLCVVLLLLSPPINPLDSGSKDFFSPMRDADSHARRDSHPVLIVYLVWTVSAGSVFVCRSCECVGENMDRAYCQSTSALHHGIINGLFQGVVPYENWRGHCPNDGA